MKRVWLLLVIALGLMMPSQYTSAQDGQAANGLQLSPTRTEMSLLPGERKEFTVSVKNVANTQLRMRSTINDFETDGVTGTPQIIIDEDRQVASSLRGLVEGLGEIVVGAGETQEVSLAVTLPEDTIPGVYYGAVRFAIVPDDSNSDTDATRVSLNASVASLIFVEVPGDIVQQFQIEGMRVCILDVKETSTSPDTASQHSVISENCEKGNKVFTNKPSVSSIEIANTGTGFSRPFGRVVLTKGDKEVYSYELNNSKPRGIVLPGSTRVFSSELEGIDGIGRYTLTANLSHGDGGTVLISSVSFWYIPAWVLYIFLLCLLALVIAAAILFNKYRSRRTSRRRR